MYDSHAVDEAEGLSWALDLTPLIHDPDASVIEYTLGYIDRLREDVIARATRVGGR